MILYFSATGNSKYVATRIAEKTNNRLVSIVDCCESHEHSIDLNKSEALGIVLPTYHWGLPSIVDGFLSGMTLNAPEQPYIYFVSTYGTTTGQSVAFVKRHLERKGFSLSAGYSVKMPDTWTPTFDLSDAEKVRKINEKAEAQIDFVIYGTKTKKHGQYLNGFLQKGKGNNMDDNRNKETKIKIVENGPYVVTGNVPLGEKIIVPKGESVEFAEGRELTQNEEYALCRCGKSRNAPFCDGTHESAQFMGTETASKGKYIDRAVFMEGISIDLYDDDRCAFARFCHSENGISTWNLMDYADDEIIKNEVIKTASKCPAGRLTAAEKNGEMIEPAFEPAIEVIQDPSRGTSGGIYVKGGVPLESAEGTLYETRNRYVLCRCGRSHDKPFCDASHIIVKYRDNKSDEK